MAFTTALFVDVWVSVLIGEAGRCKVDGCAGGADRFAASLGAVEMTEPGLLDGKLPAAGTSGEPLAYTNLFEKLSCEPPPPGR
jgi:hypothetical protein